MKQVFNEDNHYVYDLDAIFEFISDTKRNSDSEITEVFVADTNNKLNLSTRELREVKSGDASNMTMKYDMIKMFMEVCNTIDTSVEEPTFGEQVIFNTLINKGLIKEVE